MLTLDEIRKLLADRRAAVVAEGAGLHRNTVAAIRDGHERKPSYKTVKALSDYLEGAADAS